MKIGVLGGTFDPVHLGHIMMADEAMKSLGLSEIILIPAGQPMSKMKERLTPAKHRLQMLSLAVAAKPYLKVSAMEIERPGPSFTVDTITELRKKYGSQDELLFIMGWDSLAQLPNWREPDCIISMCSLVAVPRPGFPRPDLKTLEKNIPGISRRVVFLEKPRADISATDIRKKVARGESIDQLVPAPVAEYIKKHKLYQGQREVKQ
jgi:nicotinate-nucleotide adenylyltransferase